MFIPSSRQCVAIECRNWWLWTLSGTCGHLALAFCAYILSCLLTPRSDTLENSPFEWEKKRYASGLGVLPCSTRMYFFKSDTVRLIIYTVLDLRPFPMTVTCGFAESKIRSPTLMDKISSIRQAIV